MDERRGSGKRGGAEGGADGGGAGEWGGGGDGDGGGAGGAGGGEGGAEGDGGGDGGAGGDGGLSGGRPSRCHAKTRSSRSQRASLNVCALLPPGSQSVQLAVELVGDELAVHLMRTCVM